MTFSDPAFDVSPLPDEPAVPLPALRFYVPMFVPAPCLRRSPHDDEADARLGLDRSARGGDQGLAGGSTTSAIASSPSHGTVVIVCVGNFCR